MGAVVSVIFIPESGQLGLLDVYWLGSIEIVAVVPGPAPLKAKSRL